MRVLSLKLEKVGPFDEAEIEFVAEPDETDDGRGAGERRSTDHADHRGKRAGKTIILDAIRGAFGAWYCNLERPLGRQQAPFAVELMAQYAGNIHALSLRSNAGSNDLIQFQRRTPHRRLSKLRSGS